MRRGTRNNTSQHLHHSITTRKPNNIIIATRIAIASVPTPRQQPLKPRPQLPQNSPTKKIPTKLTTTTHIPRVSRRMMTSAARPVIPGGLTHNTTGSSSLAHASPGPPLPQSHATRRRHGTGSVTQRKVTHHTTPHHTTHYTHAKQSDLASCHARHAPQSLILPTARAPTHAAL